MIIVLVFAYGYDKLHILKDFGDSSLSEYVEEDYNAFKTDFGYEKTGFFFAFELEGKYINKLDLNKVFSV